VEYNIVVSNAQQEEKVTTGGLDLDGRGLLTKKKIFILPLCKAIREDLLVFQVDYPHLWSQALSVCLGRRHAKEVPNYWPLPSSVGLALGR
jgi:hypothetical protein